MTKTKPKPKKPIVPFNADVARYIGNGDDGVYYQVAQGADGWYMTAVVDSTHLVHTLVVDDGPYESKEAASTSGKNAAVEWCANNDVGFGKEVRKP